MELEAIGRCSSSAFLGLQGSVEIRVQILEYRQQVKQDAVFQSISVLGIWWLISHCPSPYPGVPTEENRGRRNDGRDAPSCSTCMLTRCASLLLLQGGILPVVEAQGIGKAFEAARHQRQPLQVRNTESEG